MQGNLIGDTVPVVCPSCRSLMRANRKLVGHMIMCSACLGPIKVQEESASKSLPSAGDANRPAPPVRTHGEILELAPDEDAVDSQRKVARGPASATPKPGESVGKQPASSDEFPEVICPGCGEKLYTAKSNFGKMTRCTACRAEFQVPNPSSSKFSWGNRDGYSVANPQAEGQQIRPGGVKNSAPPTSQKPAASEPAKSAPWDSQADDDVDDLLKYLNEGTTDSAGKSNGESGNSSQHGAGQLLNFLLSNDDEGPPTDHSSQVTAATPSPNKKKVIALCPTCSARYFVSSRKENKQIQCQKCGTAFFVKPSQTKAPQVSSARDEALPARPAEPILGSQSPLTPGQPPAKRVEAQPAAIPSLFTPGQRNDLLEESPRPQNKMPDFLKTEEPPKKKNKNFGLKIKNRRIPELSVSEAITYIENEMDRGTFGSLWIPFIVFIVLFGCSLFNPIMLPIVLPAYLLLTFPLFGRCMYGVLRSTLESADYDRQANCSISPVEVLKLVGGVFLAGFVTWLFGIFPITAIRPTVTSIWVVVLLMASIVLLASLSCTIVVISLAERRSFWQVAPYLLTTVLLRPLEWLHFFWSIFSAFVWFTFLMIFLRGNMHWICMFFLVTARVTGILGWRLLSAPRKKVYVHGD